jgi:hypothetical protein
MAHDTDVFVLDTSCLYSTVRNISGGSKKFGFIPPHGWELEDGEQRTVFGNILEAIQRGNGDRDMPQRHITAFENSINAHEIEIVNTPSPIFYDETLDASKTLIVDGGTLTVVDPCWFNSISISD